MVVTATSGKLYGRVTLKGTRTLSQHLFNQRQIGLTGKKCTIIPSLEFYAIS